MGFFSKIFGKKDAAFEDASRIYAKLMSQARRVEFYGDNAAPDNYDGRIDVLTLHMAAMLRALADHGEQGERLSQALYDVMRDDFEVAMREEGLSDTGIKKRIKPMMQLFFTRVKAYAEAMSSDEAETHVSDALSTGLLAGKETEYPKALSAYAVQFLTHLKGLSLGQIALTEFDFPAAPK